MESGMKAIERAQLRSRALPKVFSASLCRCVTATNTRHQAKSLDREIILGSLIYKFLLGRCKILLAPFYGTKFFLGND